MEFSFVNEYDGSKVKQLLKRKGISKKLLSHIKFDGGEIFVNGQEETAVAPLMKGDIVRVKIPDEPSNPELAQEDYPLEIVFEDAHYLVINKPAGYPSIVGIGKNSGSIANFVAGYLAKTNQPNQTVHLVTRLDHDTSGLMVFAKHTYAHALLMTKRGKSSFHKRYFAIIAADASNAFPLTDEIEAPIGRTGDSIIKRTVRFDGLHEAKDSRTSYQTFEQTNRFRLLDVSLHTGRTHQIRVHMSYKGFPLVGDELYGGDHEEMGRQALHCHHVEFDHLITGEKLALECSLPDDMNLLLASDK